MRIARPARRGRPALGPLGPTPFFFFFFFFFVSPSSPESVGGWFPPGLSSWGASFSPRRGFCRAFSNMPSTTLVIAWICHGASEKAVSGFCSFPLAFASPAGIHTRIPLQTKSPARLKGTAVTRTLTVGLHAVHAGVRMRTPRSCPVG